MFDAPIQIRDSLCCCRPSDSTKDRLKDQKYGGSGKEAQHKKEGCNAELTSFFPQHQEVPRLIRNKESECGSAVGNPYIQKDLSLRRLHHNLIVRVSSMAGVEGSVHTDKQAFPQSMHESGRDVIGSTCSENAPADG